MGGELLSPGERYSKRLCLRNQPLETQRWIWDQIVRNQPQFLVFATQEPLRTLRNWLAGSEAQFLTQSLLLYDRSVWLWGNNSTQVKRLKATPPPPPHIVPPPPRRLRSHWSARPRSPSPAASHKLRRRLVQRKPNGKADEANNLKLHANSLRVDRF